VLLEAIKTHSTCGDIGGKVEWSSRVKTHGIALSTGEGTPLPSSCLAPARRIRAYPCTHTFELNEDKGRSSPRPILQSFPYPNSPSEPPRSAILHRFQASTPRLLASLSATERRPRGTNQYDESGRQSGAAAACRLRHRLVIVGG
jgi:hypothetical protein